MASTYSDLKFELIGTGDQSGTWGSTTNDNIGTAIEQAIVGLGSPIFTTDANLTITLTNTVALQTARALVLNATSTGSLTATRELVVPTIEKQYIVQNNTSGGQSITVKTTAGTGITVPNGKKMHLYVDGVNVVDAVSHFSSLTLASALPVLSGGTGVTTSTGTVAVVLSTSPTLVTPVLGVATATSLQGIIGNVTPAAGSFTTLGASSTATLNTLSSSGATLTGGTINGMTVGATTASTGAFTTLAASGAVTLSGGTANGVAFLNASKVLTTGSALTFDGTNLSLTTTNAIYKVPTAGGSLFDAGGNNGIFVLGSSNYVATFAGGSEQMRLTSTGLKSSIAGTNADPVFSNTSDTNTGIFFPALDKLGFTAGGGTDQMVLTSTGLGIGTSLPTARVHAFSGTSMAQMTVDGTGAIKSGINFASGGTTYGQIYFDNNSPYDMSVLQQFSTGSLRFGTNNTESARISSDGTFRVKGAGSAGSTDAFQVAGSAPADAARIDSSGNVGIGTSSPGSKLDVRATSGSAGIMTQTSATGYGLLIVPGADTTYDALTINNAANSLNQIRMFGNGNATFAGNVGIGTGSAVSARIAGGVSSIDIRPDGATDADALYQARGTGSVYLVAPSTGNAFVNVNSVNTCTFAASGNVTIGNGNLVIGTSGKGIDFSATPGTGTSELLADYEEGTWTPLISKDGNGVDNWTSSAATGYYTKIGRLVTVQCEYTYTAKQADGGSFAFMSGLPFTPAQNSGYFDVAINNSGGADTDNYSGFFLTNGKVYFNVNQNTSTFLISNNFPAATRTVTFQASYIA